MNSSVSAFFNRLFKRNNQNVKINPSKGGVKEFFAKLSAAFMLPICVLSAVGVFLGVGETIASHLKDNPGAVIFGKFLSSIGTPVFACMPVLFGLAIAIAFTDDVGVAVFATVIGYITFSSIQGVFIDDVFIDENGLRVTKEMLNKNPDLKKELLGYTVLFEAGGRSPESLKNMVSNSLGYKSLSTSLFSGIIIGFIVSYLYFRVKDIQFPTVISFFAGKRFVSIATIFAMVPLAFGFLLFWPWIGSGINWFGNAVSKAPIGLNSFASGFIERTLIPFGLHHVTNALFQKTDVGGNVYKQLNEFVKNNPTNEVARGLLNLIEQKNKELGLNWGGDIFDWRSISMLGVNTIGDLSKEMNFETKQDHSIPIFKWIATNLGNNLGKYSQGKYAIMMFGLPAAGAAMILTAKPENRKVAMGTIIPAAATSFLTGITEPIEFTFLFLAPWMFFGFHAFMAGLSFMFANLFGAHVGLIEFGSVVEFIINGIMPTAKGTDFWKILLIGLAYIPAYFFFFYFAIRYFDIKTPGRGDNIATLYTKKDYQAKKATGTLTAEAQSIVDGLGGYENITKFDNCASRLRYDIKDKEKVDEALLKSVSYGVVYPNSNHVQIILGPKADQVNTMIAKNAPAKKSESDNITEEKKITKPKPKSKK
ncbi:MAG: hypothetical protein E7Y34_01010 [Mycoplasma sp.]|nr:hypothetical protein [Mycoplasma sp.]